LHSNRQVYPITFFSVEVSILVLMDLAFEYECNIHKRIGKNVSILVLMDLAFEYIHLFTTGLNISAVSILVLMDLAFESGFAWECLCLRFVSILVLMDLAFESRTR